MAFPGLFKKKEEQLSRSIPVDRVISMRQQGLSNNQITESLQRDGYETHQIFDAMNQADIKIGASLSEPGMQSPFPEQNQGNQGLDEGYDQGYNPQASPASMPRPAPEPEPREFGGGGYSEEKVEEIAETIIEEKWSEFMSSVQKIIEWKDKTETRINTLEIKFKELKSEFDKLHSAVLEKVGEYGKSIENVGIEIQALEKVFQKVLPTFTENVNELSRISKEFKKSK